MKSLKCCDLVWVFAVFAVKFNSVQLSSDGNAVLERFCESCCVLARVKDVGRSGDHESSATDHCAYKMDETLVLYDQCSRSVADDVTVSTSQMTSCHVVSVLLRRLKQDGFRVYLLDGM